MIAPKVFISYSWDNPEHKNWVQSLATQLRGDGAQLGVLRRRQNRLDEAVSWFGRALAIAVEYQMRVGAQISIDLARLMKLMGEEQFTVAWRQAFEGQEPPLTTLRQILGQIERGETKDKSS